jgi:CDP-glycerol glycerophosphotransferase
MATLSGPMDRRAYARNARRAGHVRSQLAARYWRELPLLDAHVMYESHNGRDFAGNPYALFRYLVDHPEYTHLHHVIAVNDADNPKARAFADHPRVTVVSIHSDEFIRYAESAKYQVNDTSFKDYVIKKPGQVYVHTWHSTLLKKLAIDTGRPWEAKRVGRALLQSDFFVSPNRFTTERLLSSHGVTPLFRAAIAEVGYPRNDLTVNVDVSRLRARLGVAAGERIALFAPTWRGNYVPENTVRQTLEDLEGISGVLPPDVRLYVKFHPMVYKFLGDHTIPHSVPDDVDINEFLGATDLLITDYSGIFYDYLLTGNPIIFYTPDLEAYAAQKDGFYLDIASLPGPLCRTIDEVGAAARDLQAVQLDNAESYARFRQRFGGADDGHACERVATIVFRGEDDGRTYRLENDKPKVLIYPANLAPNGVTASFLALLENLDYDRVNVAVLLPSESAYRETQALIDRRACVLYLGYQHGLTPREHARLARLDRLGAGGPHQVPAEALERIARNALGDIQFDCAINFNGYFPRAAGLVAFGVNAKRRVIYLHNDLDRDRRIKHPQLHSVFSLYPYYDALFCVSPESRDVNLARISRYLQATFGVPLATPMRFALNPIVPDRIGRRGAEPVASTTIDGTKYAVMRQPGDRLTGFPWPREDHVNFLAVGRLSREKNHRRLIRAFAKVAAVHRRTTLYISGDGVLVKELQQLITRLNMQGRVVLTGQLTNPLPLMRLCTCFVSSSDIEGQPITILEALVLGKPIIATDIAGHQSLLRASPGCLVDTTVADLARAMEEFVEGERQCLATFAAESYVQRSMTQFYRDVLRLPASIATEGASEARAVGATDGGVTAAEDGVLSSST